jgi:hypothetical protein
MSNKRPREEELLPMAVSLLPEEQQRDKENYQMKVRLDIKKGCTVRKIRLSSMAVPIAATTAALVNETSNDNRESFDSYTSCQISLYDIPLDSEHKYPNRMIDNSKKREEKLRTRWSPDSSDIIRRGVRKNLMGEFIDGTKGNKNDVEHSDDSTDDEEEDSYTNFLSSMSEEETMTMMEGFDSYMDSKNKDDGADDHKKDKTVVAVNEISSIDRLLFCGDQDYKHGDGRFAAEPDIETLTAVRKSLFDD